MINNTELTSAESNAIFRRLRELKGQVRRGSNQHESCIVMIAACICEGFDTRRRIVGAMTRLGFKQAHVILMLKEGQGRNPAQHRWRLGDDERYALHDEADAAS